jgi:hypothetical protein
VEDRAALGRVDGIAPEHRLGPLPEPALLGESGQEPHRLAGDAVLRVVEVDAGGLGGQPLAAVGVGGEERAEIRPPDLAGVPGQRLPGRAA